MNDQFSRHLDGSCARPGYSIEAAGPILKDIRSAGVIHLGLIFDPTGANHRHLAVLNAQQEPKSTIPAA